MPSISQRLLYCLLALFCVGVGAIYYSITIPSSRSRHDSDQFTNSIGMRFVPIPSGTFFMGYDGNPSVKNLSGYYVHYMIQFDRRETTITKPFWLGKFEVTKGQFRQFIVDTGYQTDNERLERKANWLDVGFPVSDDEPVVAVSWNDAVAFCKWLSKKDRRTYRLPTEAEWEFACRSGTDTIFSFGNHEESMHLYANVADQSLFDTPESRNEPFRSNSFYSNGRDFFPYLSPVGSFLPNALGLYDMHGNAFEYCSDFYEVSYDVNDSIDPKGPSVGDVYVVRGGSWSLGAAYATSFYRNEIPGDFGLSRTGFRVVLEERPMNDADLQD